MRSLLLPVSLTLASFAPAQVSGAFLIDPNGGPGSFATITEAINSLFISGIDGPVELVVNAGTYTESVLVPPITGASTTNTITLRAIIPGTVRLKGGAGDTFYVFGTSFLRGGHLAFEDLIFEDAPGWAIATSRFVDNLRIERCEFGPEHRPSATGEFRHGILSSDNSGSDQGWTLRNNKFTFPSRTNRTCYGIYLSNGGGWTIEGNEFDQNGADYGLYMINNNTTLDTVTNNLFYGTMRSGSSPSSSSCIRANISNYNNDFTHNTFFLDVPSGVASAITTSSTSSANNRIENNVIAMTGSGAVGIASTANRAFVSDNNLFFIPNGEIGRVDLNSSGSTTLTAWQTASNQDAASLTGDPLFAQSSVQPYDLHPAPTSPVKNAGRVTTVTGDFDGRVRDGSPDIGAFELCGFATFGRGCAGTNPNPPVLDFSGTVAIGSANFAITLSGAVPNKLAFMIGGSSRTSSSGTPLPFSIGGGCEILVAPDLVRGNFSDSQGAATTALPIPNDPSLLGSDFNVQWATVDDASPANFRIITSNAGVLQL